MAFFRVVSVWLLLLVAGSCFMFGFRDVEAKKEIITARKGDIPFIKCSVCEAIAKQLVRQVKERRERAAPKKITEYEIIDVAENICNMKKEESDWILKLDIVESGDKLQLEEQPVEGVCKTECKTIERACQEVMGDHDTDVAEYLYKPGATRAGVVKLLCKDLSKACVGKVPPVPKDRVPGESFTPKAGKEAEMEKLMRSMNDMPGAPGMKMFSREEIEKNPNLMNPDGSRNPDDGDDDDDDDDDEDDVAVKSQVKKPAMASWQESVAKVGSEIGARTDTVMKTAAKSVKKASGVINSWWNNKKKPAPGTASSASSGEL